MTAAREELHQLVDALPEYQVPGVILDLRGRLARPTVGTWPPAFFESIDRPRSGRSDVSEQIDEILAEGFGRD